ncbi:hypothetical protein [Terriglobus albidus]|uniref:hypothetical protein n=1 Tax=Terriglobus albidus TaxID=1592106 RepID=UPI0021DF7F52|nr:hypothetical protein [Terriglobus albidus]
MQDYEAVPPLAKRELVHRIIASKYFHRSERLSSFLQHICELEIQGRVSEINEKDIGRTVFQLPTDYDPSIDGIVRSHASRLRRKLEMYYLHEGREEKIRLVIPRGAYQPRFELCVPECLGDGAKPVSGETGLPSEAREIEDVSADDAWEKAAAPGRRMLWIGGAAIALFLVLSLAGVWFYRAHRGNLAMEREFWPQIFNRQRPTILVPSDSSLSVWQEFKHTNLTLADYLTFAYGKDEGPSSPEQRLATTVLSRRYTSVVDLEIIQKLSHIARALNVEPSVRFARDVRPNDLKQNNVVLIGSSETNPWGLMFQSGMNFILKKDQEKGIYTIENRKPLPGEAAEWISDPNERTRTVYCKVSYLANPSGAGNILILEGTSMAATECAWEFVSNQQHLRQFWHQAKLTSGGTSHFEVLLKTNNLAGDAAASSIVAWRVIP